MRKLIHLEIKKFKLFSNLKGVVIANLGIMIMVCLVYFADKSDGGAAFSTYEAAFGAIGSMVRATFTIFAAALISRLIIDEYKNNTIMMMFMYPINRKKIMIAKLVIVASFTFLTIFLSNLVVGGAFCLAASYLHIVPKVLTAEALTAGFLRMTLQAVASAGVALIPLYFGLMKKSVPATIITSIVLVSLTTSSSNGVDVFSIVAVPIVLAIAGCLIAYYSIRNIEKADIN